MTGPNREPPSPKEATELAVLVGGKPAGTLARTRGGARFTYSQDALTQRPSGTSHLVAFAMPPRPEPFEVRGQNLHPFFAGLLPEGLRMQALVRGVKTSQDDLFSLLAACGSNTIGNVSIAQDGVEVRPPVSVNKIGKASFQEILSESLEVDRGLAGATAPGIQPKLSDSMVSLPLRASSQRAGALLKLAPPGFDRLIENEAFFMKMARTLRLPVAEVKVIHDRHGEAGLLVSRFDRMAQSKSPDGEPRPPLQLHQEDACQLLERYPADKYRLSLREVSDALKVCSAPMVERLRLIQLQALAYLIGNGDLHAKNISVLVSEGRTSLSPIYDLLSTLPYGDDAMALKMDGRDKRLTRKDFVAFGERIGVRAAATERMLDTLVKKAGPFAPRLEEIGFDERKTSHMQRTMASRLDCLAK